ncbi:MAG TPA: M23 family metallopeptidase [Acidobacteriaceae bacterium]|jgi:hypothetical protein|nr:M23 family metallopeptidase [Acidobacteriaceae bacterium]
MLAIEAGIPALLIWWIYTDGPTPWWPWLAISAAAIATLVVMMPWCQFIPYFARPMAPLGMIVAAGHARGWVSGCASAGFLLVALALIRRQMNRGSLGQEAMEISPPLASGVYFVAQGGGSFGVNRHFRNESQRFALDILRLNWFTMRAWGFFPPQLDRFAIYNTRVLCPIAGVVTAVVDGLPDMDPWVQQDAEHIAGNHIVIRCGAGTDTYVSLAHLLAGSLQVRVGDAVSAGQSLARVGNSGNTTEPHLHVHAKRGGEPDSMLDGEAVPLRIRGRFLMRNDLFRGLAGQPPDVSCKDREAIPQPLPRA